MNDENPISAGPLDERMDAMLRSWAQARMLPPAQAESIRESILSEQAQLDPQWAADFNTWLMGVLQHARAATTAPFQGFSSGNQVFGGLLTGGDSSAPEFQPYYRLA